MMFRKEFVIKSNVKLKASDKKKFASSLANKFPLIAASTTAEELVPKSEDVFHYKVSIYDERRIEVYTVNNVPWIFVDIDDHWFPSVYFLWKFPNAIYSFTTDPSVFVKLQEGADLMLPGVLYEGELNYKKLGNLEKHAICSVCLKSNKAAVAVGITNISSRDMLECGMRGKGVVILHVVGDFLWKMGPKEPVPYISTIDVENKNDKEPDNEVPRLEGEILSALHISVEDGKVAEDPDQSKDKEDIVPVEERFRKLFLMSIKQKTVSASLPVLASTFLGSILLPFMDDIGERVNVKDTTYKKFSVFLSAMKDDGIVDVEERQKGVQYISAVHLNHPSFATLEKVVDSTSISTSTKSKVANVSAEFKEMFSVTAAVLPLIRQIRPEVKKGDPISAGDFRNIVSDYVRSRQLQSGTSVTLDDLLSQCLGEQPLRAIGAQAVSAVITWENLFKRLFAKMTPCYEFRLNDGASGLKKGKPPNVTISVARRASNKKVTLINNLAPSGVDPTAFAKDLQIAVAASASLNEVATSIGPQVQVQGEVVDAVIKLLTEKYNVPKKMIKTS